MEPEWVRRIEGTLAWAEQSRMKMKWVKQKQCALSWKLIEHYLRAVMNQERLVDLAITPVERDNYLCTEPDIQIIPKLRRHLLS
jgi:hypothetical protein